MVTCKLPTCIILESLRHAWYFLSFPGSDVRVQCIMIIIKLSITVPVCSVGKFSDALCKSHPHHHISVTGYVVLQIGEAVM